MTRLLAVTGDIGLMFATQAALAWAVFSFFGVALDTDVPFGTNRWVGLAFQFALFVLWFWVPVALFGRTIAMGVLGLAVVARDGGVVTSGHALTRAIVVPLSVLIPLAFVGLFVGKERRSLHDVAAGTVVVYDWGDRDAEQPVTIREQFSARVRRRRLAQT